jgi:hypothetical protein
MPAAFRTLVALAAARRLVLPGRLLPALGRRFLAPLGRRAPLLPVVAATVVLPRDAFGAGLLSLHVRSLTLFDAALRLRHPARFLTLLSITLRSRLATRRLS